MIRNILPKTRISNPFSKLLRPLLTKKWIKTALGGGFAVTSLASGLFLVPANTTVLASSPIADSEIIFETKSSLGNVLPGNTGVSQGYHWGHPGMDITAPLGTKIYPLETGTVIRIENKKTNYGRAVYIDYGNGLSTLYAHMGKIYVEEGDQVTTETPVGEVGLTGHTTGPHLHIEIHKYGKAVNPRPYLTLDSYANTAP